MITYRKMTAADIEAGLALCRSAGWNQRAADWKIFIDQSKYGNKVAVDDSGKVVGTVTTITYDDRFSWIGMVLVDPAMKRQGIGSQLLRESFSLLANQETIKLDATPAGREIYLKLGFEDEYGLSRMTLPSGTRYTIRINPEKNNFSSILETDKTVFGASRSELLKSYLESFPELSLFKNENTYCFGRRGENFTQIGPVVAGNIEDAKELVSASLNNIEGAVALDVADNSPFKQWLQSIGFTEQRKLIRMYRGKNGYPGVPEKQFAILGPEFG